MSAQDCLTLTRVREVPAPTQPLHRIESGARCARVVDDLITELRLGRIRTVAFVVRGEATVDAAAL